MNGKNGSDEALLTEPECFELLASQCRQAVLEQLATSSDESHSLESLAAAVTRSDDTDQFQAASLSLHHVHLPKLDEADVLDYDPNSKAVEYHGASPAKRVLEYL